MKTASIHTSVLLAGIPKRRCPKCEGTGEICDPAKIGSAMRTLRKQARLTMREVARRMGYAAMYLSDLENGNRGWTEEKIRSYVNALRPTNAEVSARRPQRRTRNGGSLH